MREAGCRVGVEFCLARLRRCRQRSPPSHSSASEKMKRKKWAKVRMEPGPRVLRGTWKGGETGRGTAEEEAELPSQVGENRLPRHRQLLDRVLVLHLVVLEHQEAAVPRPAITK